MVQNDSNAGMDQNALCVLWSVIAYQSPSSFATCKKRAGGRKIGIDSLVASAPHKHLCNGKPLCASLQSDGLGNAPSHL